MATPQASADADRGAPERAWRARAREITRRNAYLLVAGTTAVNVLFWVTDPFVFADLPEVLSSYFLWRPVVIAEGCLLWLVLRRLRPDGSELLLGAVLSVLLGTVALAFSRIGPPSLPFVHFLHLAPLATVAYSGPASRRAFGTVAGSVVLMGSYFIAEPAHLGDPYAATTVGFHVFAVLVAFVSGWRADVFRRSTFLLARQLEEQNASLEARVKERTEALRGLVARAETLREQERAGIARELHDELGQELTALSLAVDVTRLRWGKAPATVGPNLDEVAALLERIRHTARELLRELRPRVLDDLGLAPALEWLAGRVADRAGLPCELHLAEDLPATSPELATAAFRIAQEALTNAVRHAEASRLSVSLAPADGALALTITDDGRGFDPSATTPGFGLAGMRERAEGLGGTFFVESGAGRGTRVSATLPVTDVRQEEAA